MLFETGIMEKTHLLKKSVLFDTNTINRMFLSVIKEQPSMREVSCLIKYT